MTGRRTARPNKGARYQEPVSDGLLTLLLEKEKKRLKTKKERKKSQGEQQVPPASCPLRRGQNATINDEVVTSPEHQGRKSKVTLSHTNHHLSQSKTTRCHQLSPPLNINYHQMPPIATGHHQKLPDATNYHHHSTPTTTKCHQMQPVTIKNYQMPPIITTTQHQLPPNATNCNRRPSKTIRCQQFPPVTKNYHQMPQISTTRNQLRQTNHNVPSSATTLFELLTIISLQKPALPAIRQHHL
ncbi:uncharacterized protein LOC142761269 [Rhinoderma darwinii]|uniref:uncharacterized protein LOC142761269 n=1 Tax=Rhinoderma darwinii TaxID=43563 RepID=UPI003F66E44B